MLGVSGGIAGGFVTIGSKTNHWAEQSSNNIRQTLGELLHTYDRLVDGRVPYQLGYKDTYCSNSKHPVCFESWCWHLELVAATMCTNYHALRYAPTQAIAEAWHANHAYQEHEWHQGSGKWHQPDTQRVQKACPGHRNRHRQLRR